MLNFEKDTLAQLLLALLRRIIQPLWSNMRSAGSDVAGTDRSFFSSGVVDDLSRLELI